MKKIEMLYAGIFLAATVAFTSCTQNKNNENEAGEDGQSEMMSEDDHHEEGEAHDHHTESEMDEGHGHEGHDEMVLEMGDNRTWTPSGNGTDLIQSDFHFITGSVENIKPEVKEVDGSKVLELSTDGTPAVFVFHNQYGNVGMIATLKQMNFKGTIELIHHAKDLSSYEFVSINGNNMKLGRVVNGTEKVFDKSTFQTSSDWIPLKVTAAGTHYKGYIGNKTVTHGHGDKMEDGFVGIKLDGTGKIQLKSIEVAILEDE